MLRYLLILILLLASRAYAVTCTSIVLGNWSAQTTWGSAGVGCSGAVGGIPGAGDQAVLRHTVTMDVDTTIGHSPSHAGKSTTATAAAIRIWHTNSTTTDGELIIAAGVIATVRGDISMESSNSVDERALFQMDPNSKLIFDSSNASDPNASTYRVYTPDPGTTTYRTSYVRILGTAGNPVLFDTVTTGRTAINSMANNHMFIEQLGGTTIGRVDVLIQYAQIEDCGSPVYGCLMAYPDGTSSPTQFTLEHVKMTRTSGIKCASTTSCAAPSATATFDLDDVAMYDTTTVGSGTYADNRTSRSLNFTSSISKTTGVRRIRNSYFDQGASSGNSGWPGFVLQNVVYGLWPPSYPAATAATAIESMDNVVYRAVNVDGNGHNIGATTAQNVYYFMESSVSVDNPHGLFMQVAAPQTLTDSIFEYGANTANDGNIFGLGLFLVTGAPYSFTHTAERLIFTPPSGASWAGEKAASNVFNALHADPGSAGAVAAGTAILKNITYFIHHGTEAGTNYFGETMSACAKPHVPSLQIDQFRNNIGYAFVPGAMGLWEIKECPATANDNMVDPAGADHNACFNCGVAGASHSTAWPSSTAIGTLYDIPMTGTTPGTGDIVNQDPDFVDTTRSIRRWCDTVKSYAVNTCTGEEAIEYLRDGPGTMEEKIDALFLWVREGFRPQNEAYRGAGEDGSDLGAVPMSAAAGAPTVITQPVKHWTKIEHPARVESVWIAPYGDSGETFCGGCTAFSEAYILDAITRGHEAKMNSVIIYTRLNGYALYRVGNVDPVHPEIAPGFDPLRFALDTAHALGMKVYAHTYIASMANGCGSPSFPGNHIWTQHGQSASGSARWQTESAVSERQGGEQSGCGYGLYADPGHPEFFAYVTNQLSELHESYPDIDGFDLDYARLPYPVGGNLNDSYGFNDGAVARHQRRTGTSVRPTSTDAAFTTSRQRDIEFVVRNVAARAKERNPEFLMSAAVKADHSIPTGAGICSAGFYTICNTYFQKWDDWMSHGWLDKAHPMIYKVDTDPTQYDYLDDWIAWAQTHWPTRIDPGLAGYLNTPASTLAQVSRANAAGLGYVLFRHNYATNNSPPGSVPSNVLYNALGSRAPFPARAPRPDRSTALFLGDVTVGTGIAELKDGLTVEILNVSAVVVHTTYTDATGFWAATLSPGTYSVRLKALDGTTLYTSPAAIISAGHSYRQNATVSE